MGLNGSLVRKDDTNSKLNSASQFSKQNSISVSPDVYNDKLLKRHEHIDFDVEAWYPILQNETFYTEFIAISPSMARSFVSYYQARYNSRDSFNLSALQLIESIQKQLHEQIFNSKSNRFQTHGTFIRLSSRSPKDGDTLDRQKLITLYHQQLHILQEKYPNECDSIEGKANMQLVAYFNADFQCLKVTNEMEALNLILSSERVFGDLLEALICQQGQDDNLPNKDNIELYDWSTKIMAREWNNLLDPTMEFRCFVYDSNLTAISQYNHYCKFYPLQYEPTVQNIKTTIVEYWQQKIKPILDLHKEKYSNYIIDIGVIENKSSNELECIVVELNPFARSTGASLFDWDGDIQQLTGQKDEIEIRVRSDYLPNIKEWTEFILNENKLNTEESSELISNDKQSYFEFINKIRNQLVS